MISMVIVGNFWLLKDPSSIAASAALAEKNSNFDMQHHHFILIHVRP